MQARQQLQAAQAEADALLRNAATPAGKIEARAADLAAVNTWLAEQRDGLSAQHSDVQQRQVRSRLHPAYMSAADACTNT